MYNDLKDNSVELIDFFTNVCYCDKNCNVRILLFELQPSFHRHNFYALLVLKNNY